MDRLMGKYWELVKELKWVDLKGLLKASNLVNKSVRMKAKQAVALKEMNLVVPLDGLKEKLREDYSVAMSDY